MADTRWSVGGGSRPPASSGEGPDGWIVTILIGIASLVIAGLIFSSGWLEFVVGVIVAIILVALVGRFFGEGRTRLTAT
jgi:membrane protein implicated in regulation of membrane protease activity